MLALLSGDFFAPNAKSYVIRSSKLPAEPLKQLLLTEKKNALVQYAVSVNEQCTKSSQHRSGMTVRWTVVS